MFKSSLPFTIADSYNAKPKPMPAPTTKPTGADIVKAIRNGK
jgi:hypothetical protein